MADVYIDPTKLRPLPRTIVPDVVAPGQLPPPAALPALPWLLVCLALTVMPLVFSFTMISRFGQGACDRDVLLYLQCQLAASLGYLFLVAIPMWKRINWVCCDKEGNTHPS